MFLFSFSLLKYDVDCAQITRLWDVNEQMVNRLMYHHTYVEQKILTTIVHTTWNKETL